MPSSIPPSTHRGDFGRTGRQECRRGNDGRWEISTGELKCRWSGAADARVDSGCVLRLRLALPAHHHHEPAAGDWHRTVAGAPRRRQCLERYRMGVPDVSAQVCRLGRSAGLRACLLRGLTVPGGIAAAATLGMPERADAGRNYDYRYVWLCDMAYAGLAAAVQDAHELLDEAMALTTARVQTDGDKIRPSRHQTEAPRRRRKPL